MTLAEPHSHDTRRALWLASIYTHASSYCTSCLTCLCLVIAVHIRGAKASEYLLQGRHCHAKFLEAAEKAARQFRRYEGAAETPAIVSEGLEHPVLSWLAKGNKHDWADAVMEVEAYNSDFQVSPLHTYVACAIFLSEAGRAESPS